MRATEFSVNATREPCRFLLALMWIQGGEGVGWLYRTGKRQAHRVGGDGEVDTLSRKSCVGVHKVRYDGFM